MNGTTKVYTDTQLFAIAFAGLVVVPTMSIITYIWSRRRLSNNETLRSRAHLFYRTLSGTILGQCICHTQWTRDSFMPAFFVAGYLLVELIEAFGRMYSMRHQTGPDELEDYDEVGLNRQTMEINTMVVSDDLSSPAFMQEVFLVEAQCRNLLRRRLVLAALIGLFGILCASNGVVMVYLPFGVPIRQTGVVIFYYLNGVGMSVAVFGAMIHAQLHVKEAFRRRLLLWIAVSAVWSILFFCTALPVLVGVQALLAKRFMLKFAVVAVYGLTAGALLKIQQYFHQMKSSGMDAKDTIWGLVFFTVALGLTVVTGLYS